MTAGRRRETVEAVAGPTGEGRGRVRADGPGAIDGHARRGRHDDPHDSGLEQIDAQAVVRAEFCLDAARRGANVARHGQEAHRAGRRGREAVDRLRACTGIAGSGRSESAA